MGALDTDKSPNSHLATYYCEMLKTYGKQETLFEMLFFPSIFPGDLLGKGQVKVYRMYFYKCSYVTLLV